MVTGLQGRTDTVRRIFMCVVCLMAPGCLATLGHCDSTIINETFAGTTATGWQFKGAVGTAHTDDGTPLASTYYLGTAGSPHGYLELTQSGVGWQRASAFYTAQTVATTNFDIKAQVNITGGAAGLTFCFVDANSVSHDVSKLFGGYGQWEGAPRGCLPNIPSTNARGYYAGLKGFNFEFDHFKNGNEKSAEYLSMVSLSQLSADNQDWLPITPPARRTSPRIRCSTRTEGGCRLSSRAGSTATEPSGSRMAGARPRPARARHLAHLLVLTGQLDQQPGLQHLRLLRHHRCHGRLDLEPMGSQC